MFRLTREVRFAINDGASGDDDQLADRPTNSFGGYPSPTGFNRYLTLAVTLEGGLQAHSSYLRNIKDVDEVVRRRAIPMVADVVRRPRGAPGRPGDLAVPAMLLDALRDAWPGAVLSELRLSYTPFLSVACRASEFPMVRLSQRFEFSASHRLHNPALSDAENRACYGKCNNPHGHGHNYEVQVTLAGEPGAGGVLVSVPAFERVVAEAVIDRFDHKHLNTELPEFRDLIPSVENIARVIYRLLQPKFEAERARLASVTVWETPKTWCEYSE